MIINDKVLKKRNKKLKWERHKKRTAEKRLKRRTKKIINLLRKRYINTNNVNIELDETLFMYPLKEIMENLKEAKLIDYANQGSIYKVKILTSEEVFNKTEEEKSSTRANFKTANEPKVKQKLTKLEEENEDEEKFDW